MIKRILLSLLVVSALVPSAQAMNESKQKNRIAQIATFAARHKGKIACGLAALAICGSVQGVHAGPVIFNAPSGMCAAVSIGEQPVYALNETAAQMWETVYENYIAQTALDSVPRMVMEMWHNKYENIIELFESCYLNGKPTSLATCYHG